jgi:hypothetical protein
VDCVLVLICSPAEYPDFEAPSVAGFLYVYLGFCEVVAVRVLPPCVLAFPDSVFTAETEPALLFCKLPEVVMLAFEVAVLF